MPSIPKQSRKVSRNKTRRQAAVKVVRMRLTPSRGVKPRDEKGETLPADLLDLDQMQWFLLNVRPGSERMTRMVLRAAGFGTCLPMNRVANVARSRHRKGGKHRFLPALPGYLFVGMSADTPGWPQVFAPSTVFSAVGAQGAPYRFTKAVVDQVAARFESEHFQLTDPDAGRQTDFRVGDHVTVLSGPLVSQVATITRMDQNAARVMFSVFGKSFETDIPLDELRESPA
jgi:transcription antitermination factor NusG